MATQTKNGQDEYKRIMFDYSVYGASKSYSGKATIYLHYANATQTVSLELSKNFDTLEQAEQEIVKSVQCWIDKNTK